jgi:flagellar M-ring protein FliF
VASAVNGMKPERVSVIDETGRLLADGAAQDKFGGGVTADERKAGFESRLRNQVEAIVSSVVGPGKARVQISADFDMNRITETHDKYDPDGRVLRSSQSREEQSNSSEGREGGQVSVAGELPGANRDGSNNNAASRDQSRKTEEIVNYEISRTTKTEVTEAGRLNRLSAAVLVDGRYTRNDKGEMIYEPRPKEEIDRIAALVRTAIGFDAKRGDQIEVVNLRFADAAAIPLGEDAGWMKYFTFTKDDIMGMAEKGVMALLGLIVLLMVVRPLVRRVIAPDAAEKARLAGMAGVAGALGGPGGLSLGGVPGAIDIGPDGMPLSTITDKSGTNISIVGSEDQVAISNRTSAMIDVAKVQGQVHAMSVQKVGELAEKNPHEAVSIIRSWLHEDAA